MTVVRLLTLALLAALFVPAPAAAQPVYQLVGCTASQNLPSPTTSLIVDIDLATGIASNFRDTGITYLGGIAPSPQPGALLGLTTFPTVGLPNSLVSISAQAGGATFIGLTGLSLIVEGDLALNPVNGSYYGIQDASSTVLNRFLFRVDPVTGAATVVGDLPYPDDYNALAFSPTGMLLAVSSRSGFNDMLHIINPQNAEVLESITMNVRLGDAAGMAIHPLTGQAYVAGGGVGSPNANLFSLDLSSGSASMIGPLGIPGGVSGLAFVAVPEPSAVTLAIVAMSAFFIKTRRRAPVHTM